jgi:hypothetical protein
MFARTSLLAMAAAVVAQDPAEGWMAYAVGAIPQEAERITRLEMTWTVGEEPRHSFAFFSPWFGMDPNDNLNLVQPVNPWSGRSWSMYTEYFQWSPTHNSNSKQFAVSAGDTLHGSIVYVAEKDAYELKQTNTATGDVSSQVVPCQSGKKYRIPYVVYEKTFPCASYPPDGVVTFSNITVECDGQPGCAVQWEAKVKDPNCNMQAHVDHVGDRNEISITWDTAAASKYDSLDVEELYGLNAGGWGAAVAKRLMSTVEQA